MRSVRSFAVLFGIVAVFASAVSAQETETKVVDEVVAQINDGVLTLSRVNREAKSLVDSYVQEGKPREEAQKLVDDKRGEMIAGLINEELLIQKAKDLGLDSDVDSSINAQFLAIMKQNNVKTLDALYKSMTSQGVDPQDVRENWRRQITREKVLQRDVQQKVYWEASGAEVKAYYDSHKSLFTKPETVSISEIFLSFAGRDEKTVRARAAQLVTQLRAGADFQKLAVENSDRQDVATTKGKVDTISMRDLDPKFADALKGVKVGGVTDPIELDGVGVNILRVDDRVEASNESAFDENTVRLAILQEKMPEAQKKYMAKLREDAYIKINDTYRPMVSPILFADERKDTKPSK